MVKNFFFHNIQFIEVARVQWNIAVNKYVPTYMRIFLSNWGNLDHIIVFFATIHK
jgi:hypothetical protein